MRRLLLLASSLIVGCPGQSDAPAPASAEPSAKPAPTEDRSADAQAAKPAEPEPAKIAFKPNDVVVDHQVETLEGKTVSLADYRGKALLLVNTASECGFTPQYADLQKVYEEYRGRGLEVLAFPSNDFGEQEPGSPEEIRTFVDEKFSIDFPMFAKVHATGPEKSELYKTLTEKTGEGISGDVKWNFTKFLVDPNGRVVARFESPVNPTAPEVRSAIESVLPK